jgi:PAS domain S-box-containing protein
MGGQSPELAAWLISRRSEIEQVMAVRLGPAAPSPAAAESEVLRRFRSFAAAALKRGTVAEPALDGIKANERRVTALLTAWCEAAADVAGHGSEPLREALQPLVVRFRSSLRTTGGSRRSRGAPRAARRAVTAAIDRVADSFLAVDADSGRIVDANPAAGALLGVARDALLDVEATSFVPTSAQGVWWTHFDAMTEGGEARRFSANLRDVSGSTIPVECTITRFSTRDRTLALMLARPL